MDHKINNPRKRPRKNPIVYDGAKFVQEKSSKKIKVRDKFFLEDTPLHDLDFVELSLPPDELQRVIEDSAAVSQVEASPEDVTARARYLKKKERLTRKIFKAASEVLTDKQFQVFIRRTAFHLKERVIAKQLGVVQPYVSMVMKASIKKIKARLHIKEFEKEQD